MDIAVATYGRSEAGNTPQSTPEMRAAAAYILRVRKAAKSYFGSAVQSEPAWKLLLALYSAGGAADECRIGSAAKRADIPLTTAIRWLYRLHGSGIVSLRDDPKDDRAVLVKLTGSSVEFLQRSFVAARYITK